MSREEYQQIKEVQELLQERYDSGDWEGMVDSGTLAQAADALDEVVVQMADIFENEDEDADEEDT